MLVEDHLRPAAKQVIEIPRGHRFGFHNLRHALSSFLVEIGTDPKTHGGSGKDDRSHGSERAIRHLM
jgi:hypothetical protein